MAADVPVSGKVEVEFRTADDSPEPFDRPMCSAALDDSW
jgi:hypothetical protein